jgi:hypothetical protein
MSVPTIYHKTYCYKIKPKDAFCKHFFFSDNHEMSSSPPRGICRNSFFVAINLFRAGVFHDRPDGVIPDKGFIGPTFLRCG